MTSHPPSRIGLLLSGGLDSAILLGQLLEQGRRVQPFYVQAGLHWEKAELDGARAFVQAMASPRLDPLVVLNQSVQDLYDGHWSLTGDHVPDATTPDAAVYLPGRNVLLIAKVGLWCQMHGIEELALAVLHSNPFPDARPEFFAALERTLTLATGAPLRVLRPFEHLPKADVMRCGENYPLELSFSCIDPQQDLHCGRCNKCAERQQAFVAAQLVDRTRYANSDRAGEVSILKK